MSDQNIINEVRDKIRQKQEITQKLVTVWKKYLEIGMNLINKILIKHL